MFFNCIILLGLPDRNPQPVTFVKNHFFDAQFFASSKHVRIFANNKRIK